MAPRILQQQLPYRVCKSDSTAPLKDTALSAADATQPFKVHFPEMRMMIPAILPALGDVETLSEFLVETEIKIGNDLQALTKLLPPNFW